MNSRTLSSITIIAFLAMGLLFMGLRWYRLEQAKRAREEQRWELIYTANFDAEITTPADVAKLRWGLPINTRYCKVLNLDHQPWNAPNLVARETTGPMTGSRVLELTTNHEGRYQASVKFLLRVSQQAEADTQLENLTIDQRQYFLRPIRSEGAAAPSEEGLRKALELVPDDAETDAERVHWVFNYCMGIDSTAEGDAVPTDDFEVALANMKGSPRARGRAMVALCRALRIPARLVAGFRIQQGANTQPQVWVEVYQQQAWVPYDPNAGWSLTLPMDYVPAWRDSDQIHRINNIGNFTPTYSIRRLPPSARVLQSEIQHPLQIFNLTRLPFPMHRVMKILLLLPFAALITAIVRNVIGVQTFGTFAPSLLAMSFIYAEWKTGLLILIIVVMIGLFGRAYLERLRLLMVPRLSIILTLVILCVVFGVSALHYLLPSISTEAVLLPMVILTILIERFHVTVEEDGLMYAVQLTVGTLGVALLCYLVLRWDEVGTWVLTYPEIHFFTIAAFILLGRYAGYRLTELWRFRDLVEPSEPAR